MSSTTSRIVRLTALPDGLPQPEHLTVEQAPMPVPDDGEVLVRNRFFQVFPSLRTLIGGGVEGSPFPALRPGDALFGAAIGEVVAAPTGSTSWTATAPRARRRATEPPAVASLPSTPRSPASPSSATPSPPSSASNRTA